jgi:predicted DNA-binding transcriptional regulator YafY
LGVTERAARRYVEMLREAGIRIDARTGPYGGYRLGRGLRLPPLTFSAAEALALVMAVLDGHHDVTDPTDAVSTALAKIMRSLPESVAHSAEAVRRAASAAPDRAAARPEPQITTALIEAVETCRVTRIDYQTEGGSRALIDVEPWAVVVRHGRWYLLCRSVRADATRAYRVDRVVRVEGLPGHFVPPPQVDPVRSLEQHLASGWDYEANVVIFAALDELGRQVPPALGHLERIDDATTRLRGTTSNPRWYAEQLVVGLRAPFHIAGGDEVRDASIDLMTSSFTFRSPKGAPLHIWATKK